MAEAGTVKGEPGVEAHVLHADGLLALMHGDGVPDRHIVGGQVELVGAGQGIVAGEWVGEGWDWLIDQVEDLRWGEADEAITH